MMDPLEQEALIRQLYSDRESHSDPYADEIDSNYPTDNGSVGALGQAAGVDDMATVPEDDIGIAQSHLQEVIQNLTARQMLMNDQMNPATGPNRATMMAFLGGLGSGYGSFGTGVARGMSAAAPYEKNAEQSYQQGLSKLDELRIKAAQAESLNNYRNVKRQDVYTKMGMKLNSDGTLSIDPEAMKAVQMRAKVQEAGKLSAQGLDGFGPDVGGGMDGGMAPAEGNEQPVTEINEKIAGLGFRPQVNSQLKAVLEGRQPIQGYMLRNPYWQKMLLAANQVDPEFDAANYNARSKLRQDFTSGPSAKALNSINTVAGHVNNLIDKADALGNTWSTHYNSFSNYLLDKSGDPRIKEYNTVKNALSSELSKAYKTTGAITQKEKDDWEHDLDTASSPAQFHGVAKTISELLESKIKAYEDQWHKGMGIVGKDTSFIAPHARVLFDRFESSYNSIPPGAIAKLKKDPTLAKAFEEKYGVKADSFLKD